MGLAASSGIKGLEAMGELPPAEGFSEDDLPPAPPAPGGRKVVFAPEGEESMFCRACGGKPALPREDRDACLCKKPMVRRES